MSAREVEMIHPYPSGTTSLNSVGNENSHTNQDKHIVSGRRLWVMTELGRISQKLAEVPHDESGLNIPRIGQFFEENGLDYTSQTPFVGVDEDGQQEINEIMGFGRGTTNTFASHFPLLGFTYVVRGLHEATVGVEAIEANAVHEISHGIQPHKAVLTYKLNDVESGLQYLLPRYGFTLFKCGNYLEEGYASLMEHKYITNNLGLTNGFMGISEPQKIQFGTNDTYFLPSSYVHRSRLNDKPTWFDSAHASYGMQLLIAKDPEIFPALIESRKDVEGSLEVVKRVNSLNEGLYSQLNKQPYDSDRFMMATRYIIDKLYDGNQRKALNAATEQDSIRQIAA